MMRGEIAIAGRVGRQRVWDLAERVYPAGHAGRPGRRGAPGSATSGACGRWASPARRGIAVPLEP